MHAVPSARTALFALSIMGLSACGDDPLRTGLDAIDGRDGLVLGDTADASDADNVAIDTTTPDTASHPDTTTPDTASHPDTESPADTAAPDLAEPDTASPLDTLDTLDTLVADTLVPDTVAPDTLVPDTTESDTAAPDATDTADAIETGEVTPVLPAADQSQLSAPPYLMWVTQTEVSVRWETKSAIVGQVDYGPTDALGATLIEDSPRTTHELRLTGLAPNAINSYRVRYGGGALPLRHFRTAPGDDSTAAFRFIVWGDNQDGPGTFSDLVPLMADIEPRFAVSVGDCVQNGTRGEYRSQLFSPMSGFADEVPYLVAAGNHERYSDPDANLFDEYFSQPGDEHCFGWRYGGLFILFIDTDLGLDGATGQRECINAQLQSEAARTATIRAAAFHKPPRIEWWFGGFLAFPDSMEAPYVREQLEPLLEAYDVNIVFNGHNHLYAHTPKTPGGITWVTTGGGGGKLDERGFLDVWRVGTWPQIETTIHDFHFLAATMDDDTLFIDAIDRDGEVMHSFAVVAD